MAVLEQFFTVLRIFLIGQYGIFREAMVAVWKWELLEWDTARFSETFMGSKWEREVSKNLG